MQKKNINIILIIAVALIWGVLLYKFISPYFVQKDTVLTADMLVTKPKLISKKKDTVNLSFPARDPFLEKPIAALKKTAPIKMAKNRRPTRTSLKVVEWPKITYLGFVKSKNSPLRLGLVRINGKLNRVNKNTVVEGVKILRIDKDSIHMAKGNEKRFFKKMKHF